MRLSMHKITLVSLDVLEAYIQNVGLTGCEEQRDRLEREKDMHMLWYLVLLFLKTHGTAVSCYTGEEERKQQSKEINCLINV